MMTAVCVVHDVGSAGGTVQQLEEVPA